jgi:predicted ATP-grasp superfamily ATP-dependent carboligase
VYVGDGRNATLLGVSRQLIGQDWLHAGPFQYCGSIGPPRPEPTLLTALQQLGKVVAAQCRLRGLFGVDCVVREGVPWPVEVNPRYTASVEVLEYAQRLPALALHRRVFDATASEPPNGPVAASGTVIGKAILFARADLTFPADGPWMATLQHPPDLWELPAFADIPPAGSPLRAGRPILSFFAQAASMPECEGQLRATAAELDRWLAN